MRKAYLQIDLNKACVIAALLFTMGPLYATCYSNGPYACTSASECTSFGPGMHSYGSANPCWCTPAGPFMSCTNHPTTCYGCTNQVPTYGPLPEFIPPK